MSNYYRGEGGTILFRFCSTYIEAIGYNAQRAILEVRMAKNGQIRRYTDVPEEVWYRFRESASPDMYYRRCICGHFRETVVSATERKELDRSKGEVKNKVPLDKKKNLIYTKNENGSQN